MKLRNVLYRKIPRMVAPRIQGTPLFPIAKKFYWVTVGLIDSRTVKVSVGGFEAEFCVEGVVGGEALRNYLKLSEGGGERVVLQNLLQELEEKEVFYDLGSHTGIYACLGGKKAAYVLGVDADEECVTVLRRNLERNDVTGTGLVARLGDESENRLDAIVDSQGVPLPDVVKIDVEGCEHDVLEGARDTILKEARAVYVEIHPEMLKERGKSPEEVVDLLESAGFSVEVIHRREPQRFLKAVKRKN